LPLRPLRRRARVPDLRTLTLPRWQAVARVEDALDLRDEQRPDLHDAGIALAASVVGAARGIERAEHDPSAAAAGRDRDRRARLVEAVASGVPAAENVDGTQD